MLNGSFVDSFELVWDAQERDAVISLFIQYRRKVINLSGMIFLFRGQSSSLTGLSGKV